MKKNVKRLICLTIIVACFLLTGCSDENEDRKGLVTIQQFNQLENNMPFDEVIELLGKPTSIGIEEVVDEVEYKDVAPYYWDGVAPDSFIVLFFRNERLFKKEQFGLME